MRFLFATLQHVVELLKNGVYDFHTLPKKMKGKMGVKMHDQINDIQRTFHQGNLPV